VLEVRVSNYGAIDLYKAMGYKIDSIKKKYYRDGENAYYMIKKL
jgi:ribosomal-protein-alanine N-acetyltransferase